MDVIELIEKGKIKRVFRARRKLNFPNIFYHITQRAAGKEPLFVEDDDYLAMISFMKEASIQYNMNIHAFCLMPNHIHLLLQPQERNLSDFMRSMLSRYAARFNRKYERKGHLFGGPYRQAVCLEDAYVLAVSVYIHLNPVRAGLVSDPIKYRWATTRLYCHGSKNPSFVDAAPVLQLISSKEGNPGKDERTRYKDILKRAADLEVGEVMEQEGVIENFVKRLREVIHPSAGGFFRTNKIPSTVGVDLLSFEQLEAKVEEIRQGLLDKKPESAKAKRFVIEQLIARGYKREEIARRLGMSRKTVYNLLRKAPSS